MATPTFNNTEIARVAGALWGSKLGSSSMSVVMAAVNTNGLSKVVNDAYNASFGAVANADVAAIVIANLGITGAAAAPAVNAVKATLDGAAAGTKGAALVALLDTFAGMTADATYGAYATDFNSKVASALTFSQTANTVDAAFVTAAPTPVTSFNLTTSNDALTGSAGDDTFTARILGTSNTFTSGDVVNGGAGNDRINMDMGNGQGFAVTVETSSIETIQIRAQARAGDTGDNNIPGGQTSAGARVDIDGERMVGVNRWDSNNSRADVIVEDVRILDTQITNDITVGMIQTDPGNVDYGLYFDQHSLRANANSSGTLRLQLLDTRAAAEGGAVPPLRDSPYNGVSFTFGGETITLADPAGDDGTYNGPFNKAQTYAELLKAIQDYLAADSRTNGIVTAALGSSFSANDTKSGVGVTGTEIVLTAPSVLGTGNWIANAGVPSDSGLHTSQSTSASTSQDLIAVKVILDDVGRGNLSGDLVIGGLSIGTTDNCDGVQRFNVTVERTSDLQNMMSTNNKLKEVVIVNGTTKGNLTVRGNDSVVSTVAGSDVHGSDQLPGMNDVGFGSGNQRDAYGFNDIRLIDASAMTGKVAYDALISAAVLPKYVLLSDTQSDPTGDNTSGVGLTNQVADFKYSGGTNNDTIAVLVDTGVASSHSHVLPGHEDFTLNVAGNAGDDRINVDLNDGDNGLVGGVANAVASNWYQHQHVLKNLTIDAGDGNDTVRTPGAGDFTVTLGAGNDTVYTDNTGAQAIDSARYPNQGRAEWVFNSKDQTVAANVELDDIASDLSNDAMDLYRASITVTYKHLTATVQLPSSNATGAALYKPTDLFVNQAIKNAIMNDAVLSKLLVAEDGPGYSLVVRSLIDGAQVAGDLTVRATPVTVTNLSTTEQAAVIAAYSAADAAALQVLLDAGAAGLGTALVGLDYASALGRDGGTAITGAISITPSDNKVTPGTGDDVVVLGTTVSTFAAPLSEVEQSNDTVIYAGTFGKDTIVHFTVGANTVGGDKLDLTALSGKVSGGFLNDVGVVGFAVGAIVANRIVIDDKVATANDSQTAVIAKFADSGSATAASQVYIVVDAANVGSVWKITDAAAGTAGAVTAATGSNVTADLMGTIDLADTLWLNMVVANFA